MRSSMKLWLGVGAMVAPLAACDLAKSTDDGILGKLGVPDTTIVEKSIKDGTAALKYTSTIEGSTFKCLLSGGDTAEASAWAECPAEGLDVMLVDGVSYLFKVKAIAPNGLEDPTPAEASLSSADASSLVVQGADQLVSARSGKVMLVFADPTAQSYTCSLDKSPLLCGDGRLQLDLDTLPEGSHQLAVSALYADGLRRQAVVNFCAKACSQSRASALANDLQIGDFYTFSVLGGYHVTEYSTTKTTGVLSFFRVLPKADPYYLGNYKCDAGWDSIVAATSPAGEALEYCHSTPTRAAYKDTHEFRLANNHVEISTDAAKVADSNHERMSVSIYDTDWEFMTARSRFKNLCRSSEVRSRRLPMVNDFFYGRLPEEVTFWYCDVIIPARNGASEVWKIGAFIDIDQLDWNCADCIYPRAVEVIYMARPDQWTSRADYFAKQAQERILKHLKKLQP